jgi:uncharacterized protein
MAVQKSRKTPSKRGMRRSHNALKNPALSEDQAEGLDSSFEVYVIGEEEDLDSIDLITDEILLSIPMAPSHNFDCSLKRDKEVTVEEIRKNPFDVLKNIKMTDFGKE